MHVKEVSKAQYQPNHAVAIDAFRAKIGNQLGTVAQREENWDEYESKKPSALALNNAKRLMEELLDRIISAGHSWLTPFISSDEDGHVTAEWYSGDRELHFIIREQEAVYIKVWGTNIENEMHVDVLATKDYLDVWNWLLDER